jgi:nicotinamide mononucleotide transporter
MNALLNFFKIDIIQLTILVLGVSVVLLARANNVWLFPTGIIAVLLSIWTLYDAQLFADCLLHIYYLVMSVYGWFYWRTKNQSIRIAESSKKELLIATGIVIIAWSLLYVFLVRFTQSPNPVWDSWVSATGWSGMWLLARRKVENWILLNISNAFAIPLLVQKNLILLALLTGILFLVACKGYFDWKKIAATTSNK